ncbi:hypothetical protein H6G90_17140 [Nostoc sp. FACHB-145]|nr:hypothetical protein [Nostoc sp. FACHB-145]
MAHGYATSMPFSAWVQTTSIAVVGLFFTLSEEICKESYSSFALCSSAEVICHLNARSPKLQTKQY